MKKISRIITVVLAVLLLASLISCSQKQTEDDGPTVMEGLTDIQPFYVGETVTDTQHTFKKSDFKVVAIFEGNLTRNVDDFTYEVDSIGAGVYIINFYYGGLDNVLYVPIEMDFYPSGGGSN